MRTFVEESIGYDLSQSIDVIRPSYLFDVSCAGSVPQAITAFLESHSVEHAIRLAVSLGGDADTLASIAGSIAEPSFVGVPEALWRTARDLLDGHLLGKISEFCDLRSTPSGK